MLTDIIALVSRLVADKLMRLIQLSVRLIAVVVFFASTVTDSALGQVPPEGWDLEYGKVKPADTAGDGKTNSVTAAQPARSNLTVDSEEKFSTKQPLIIAAPADSQSKGRLKGRVSVSTTAAPRTTIRPVGPLDYSGIAGINTAGTIRFSEDAINRFQPLTAPILQGTTPWHVDLPELPREDFPASPINELKPQ